MPIFPSDRPSISLEVPGVNVNPAAAGAPQEALARVGAQLSQTAVGMLEQIKQSEARDAESSAYYDDFLADEEYRSKFLLTSPDGYVRDAQGTRRQNADGTPRTVTQEYRDWANARYERNQEQMPSQLAQEMYKGRAGDFFSKRIASMYTDEQRLKVSAFEQSTTSNLQRMSDSLVSAPEVNKAYTISNSLSLDIQAQAGKLIGHPVAEQKIRASNAQVAESTLKGAYNQVLAGAKSGGNGFERSVSVEYWRDVLRGDDDASKQRKSMNLPILADMLDPDRKAQIEEDFIRLGEKAKELDRSDYNARKSEAVASLKTGRAGRVDMGYFQKTWNEAIASKKLTPFEVAQDAGELAAARQIGNVLGAPLALSSPREREQIVKKASSHAYSVAQHLMGKYGEDKTVGTTAENSVNGTLGREVNSLLSQETDDFSAFSAENFPASRRAAASLDFSNPADFARKASLVQESLREMDTIYKDHFPSDSRYWRVISRGNSKQLASTLMNPTYNTQQTAQGLKSLVSAYGDRYPELMDQMIRDGHLHEGWRFAAIMPGYLATEDVVSALKGRSEALQKNFDSIALTRGVKANDFDAAVASQVSIFVAALSQQSPNDTIQANQVSTLNLVVKTKAMQRFIESAGAVSAEEAAKQAAQALIHQNVHLVQVGGGFFGTGQKSIMAIPRWVGSRKIGDIERDQITKFAESHVDAKALKVLGVVPPTGADGRPSQFADKFYEQIERTGRFSMDKSQRGLTFWYFDRQANRDVQGLTLDKQGNLVPLFVPLETALTPNAQTERARPVNPPVFQPRGN
jgi:hypothetical protein